MRTSDSHSFSQVLVWQLKSIAKFAGLSLVVVLFHELSGYGSGLVPAAPITVLGGAIGIYVSFRTQYAYERWWEGRKLWGQLVNTTRHFTQQTLSYLRNQDAALTLLKRQALYAHVLRCTLRKQALAEDQDARRISEELGESLDQLKSSPTATLLRRQLVELEGLAREGVIDPWRMQSFDETLEIFLDVQGGCERILNTPLPPGPGYIAELLIRTFAVLLPLALLEELGWLALPVSVVICLALKLISEVGRALEEPFSLRPDALPLLALSRSIERDLRESIDEPAPEQIKADDDGVVM